MLKLYVFPGGFGQPSLSPFSTKVMVHLTLSGLAYELRRGDPRSAPLGKLPWLKDGEARIPDSGRIVAHLAEHHGVDLDRELSPEQRGRALLIRRTCEEHLYWAIVHSRWITDAGWAEQRKAVGPLLPALLRPVLLPVLRGSVRKALHAQGLGRHEQATIEAFGVADLEALEAVVEGPFTFGECLSSVDVVLYAFVGGAAAARHDNRLTAATKASPKLMKLVAEVEARYRAAGGKDCT